ncbi:helix-turn-helix transcriptional regulator [Haliscomenobacter sp.]|uniref:helix-turn-helix transcriptional regulator n=1 Tax=Haliscomenobacter sp. TaxID=2717303 RepID=UPI003364C9FA
MNQEHTVNQKVRQFRLEKNRTQLAIAELIGVSERHYRKLESGERSFLFEHVLKIAEYLATPIELFYPPPFFKQNHSKEHTCRASSASRIAQKFGTGIAADVA